MLCSIAKQFGPLINPSFEDHFRLPSELRACLGDANARVTRLLGVGQSAYPHLTRAPGDRASRDFGQLPHGYRRTETDVENTRYRTFDRTQDSLRDICCVNEILLPGARAMVQQGLVLKRPLQEDFHN